MDLTRLRYYASLGLIAAGVVMILFVAVGQIGSEDDSPPPVPAAEPLAKAGPESCPPDWRYLDNTLQRYTVCVPLNLISYDGTNTTLLENATADDWQRLFTNDFVLVNDAWLNPDLATDAFSSLRPIGLRIDVVPPTAGFDGCDLRDQTPGNAGVVSCTDRLSLEPEGVTYIEDGPAHTFKALIPTQAGKSVNEVFSLYLSIHSRAEDWELQEPLFREIMAHLKPY
jgi:hypothetical protein